MSYVFNNRDNPHSEIAKIEKTINNHIGWAVNGFFLAVFFQGQGMVK
jgi:hypothetical protein